MKTLARSFIGGEITPDALARVDDAKVQNGAAELLNMRVTAQGVAYKRPGRRFVNRVKDGHTLPINLIPYRISADRTVGVEVGSGYLRFHSTQGSLLHAVNWLVASVDIVADTLTMSDPHGLANDDRIRVISPAGTAPAGVDEMFDYFAVVVDTHTVKLSTVAGGFGPVNITGVGTGEVRVYVSADVPAEYSVPQQGVSSAASASWTWLAAHTLATGDPVFINAVAGAPSVPPMVAGQIVYARLIDGTHTSFHLTEAAALAGTGAIVGGLVSTIDCRKSYQTTDRVFWRGAGKGFYYVRETTHDIAFPVPAPPALPANFYRFPDSGEYEIPSPWDNSDAFELNYDQDEDELIVTHADYDPRKLRFVDATAAWRLDVVTFAAALAAPTGVAIDTSTGQGQGVSIQVMTAAVGAPYVFTSGQLAPAPIVQHNLGDGEVVYVTRDTPGQLGNINNAPIPGYFRVVFLTTTTFHLTHTESGAAVFRDPVFADPLNGVLNGTERIRVATQAASETTYYKVTAVDKDGRESAPSAEVSRLNNLTAESAFNRITWNAVAGAERYRIYKRVNGLFGLVGDVEVPNVEFVDDNIEADFTITLPLNDTELAATRPAAVSYFDQRAVYALGNRVWLTQTGTSNDLTHHLPLLDTDRISFEMRIGIRAVVRHLLGLGHLMAMTDSAEVRITPLNSDVLSPSSISNRVQSRIGAAFAKPQVFNASVLFAAARGGHVFEMSFRQESGGFVTSDVCLRANHLFDGRELVTATQTLFRDPTGWFVSSDGGLLGLTYSPEEQVGAWHQHRVDGAVVEAAVGVADGSASEQLLLVVRRTLNGVTERFIEADTPERAPADEGVFVDASVSFDGRNTDTTFEVRAADAMSWVPGDTVTVFSDEFLFRLGTVDAGEQLILIDSAGAEHVLTLLSVLGYDTVSGFPSMLMQLTSGTPLPAELRNVATTSWAVARRRFRVTHLAVPNLRVCADGEPLTVDVVGGEITLPVPARLVHAGLGYTARLKTVPLAAQVEAAAQGMTKAVKHVWLRVDADTLNFRIGPSVDRLNVVRPQDIRERVARVLLPGLWSELGQVVVESSEPTALVVLGATLDVAPGA